MASTSLSVSEDKKEGLLKALIDIFKIKVDFSGVLKKSVITIVSVLAFLGIWQLGSSYLYNVEADSKIEKVLSEQGSAAAETMRRLHCIR